MKKPTELKLGSNVIELLIPHRRPLLMVDSILAYDRAPVPRLLASRHISANEEVFSGHFPSLHLWPGAYTQEGLGQSCYLLSVLSKFQKGWETLGGNPEDVLAALRNLELGFRLHPGYRPDLSARLFEPLRSLSTQVGVSSSVEMKFLAPVFPGQRLDYDVRLTLEIGDQLRFEVEALVDEKAVARGVMMAMIRAIAPAISGKGNGVTS